MARNQLDKTSGPCKGGGEKEFGGDLVEFDGQMAPQNSSKILASR